MAGELTDTNRRLALLIDGDNAQAALLSQMLVEVSKYGTLTVRRIYGDWTEANMKSWREVLQTNAIQPVQQFRYTTGKNATDSTLIIDAMDILYTTGVDGFCIASSDSDYTRLATRLRENGKFVLGIGRKLTPPSFVNACNIFVYTENLQPVPEVEVIGPVVLPNDKRSSTASVRDISSPTRMKALFREAIDLAIQEDGWAHLSAVGNFLRQLDPGFDPRTYGHKQLSQLVQANPNFIETQKRTTDGNSAVVYIRLKPGTPKSNAPKSK